MRTIDDENGSRIIKYRAQFSKFPRQIPCSSFPQLTRDRIDRDARLLHRGGQRDIVGMARYRVLLRSRLVELPKLAFQRQRADGGRDSLHIGDQVIRITDQPGLQGNPRRWSPVAGCPQ